MHPLLSEPAQIRLLYLDDDEMFLDVSRQYLERETEGISITTETDPEAALRSLEEQQVDCIISDYDMPEMDGLAFLDRVRERDADTPFILFTGKGSEEVAAQAIRAGVDSYLRKQAGPAQYSLLANRVETLVDQAWARKRARKMEQTYELLAKTATDAFWIREMETNRTLYSEGIRRFGYEPGIREDGFEWWASRVHPEDRDDARELNERQREGLTEGFDQIDGEFGEFTHQYRWQCADGSYVTCTSRGIVRFEDDTPVEMVGAMTEET